MKPKLLLLLMWLLPAAAFCQTIDNPRLISADDHTTKITKIEVTAKNTIISFKHISTNKGEWIQVNKSIYLQDGSGEDRYAFVKAVGIPLRPERHVAAAENEVLEFKVYFEKLKPNTQTINVIERALSPEDRTTSTSYLNFYGVILDPNLKVKITDVQLTPPPPEMVTDTVRSTDGMGQAMDGMGPMMEKAYSEAIKAKAKFYSNPDNLKLMAETTKKYYDALIKAGFGADQALKIITSKSLISAEN